MQSNNQVSCAKLSLSITKQEAESRFSVMDIEVDSLSSNLRGTFDIIWLESCLHHFVDPISALENLANAMKPDGLLVLIEFENRMGSIKEEYMKVMREFKTLERPYARAELESILRMVGLPEYEFLGTVNGWYSPLDPVTSRIDEMIINNASQMNLAICAKQESKLNQIFPYRLGDHTIRFGRGFYENVNGYRWVAPSAELTVNQALMELELEIHSVLPKKLQRNQIIIAYGNQGERGRCTLSPSQTSKKLLIADVEKGESITFLSAEAFNPSWNGSDDNRLLSFYIKNSVYILA